MGWRPSCLWARLGLSTTLKGRMATTTRRRFPPLFLLVGTAGAGSLPCGHLILCSGRLLKTVQLSGVFNDSKTFVDSDMPLNASVARVLAAADAELFNASGAPGLGQIRAFLAGGGLFGEAGSDLERWVPGDWQPDPDIPLKSADSSPQVEGVGLRTQPALEGALREFQPSLAQPHPTASTGCSRLFRRRGSFLQNEPPPPIPSPTLRLCCQDRFHWLEGVRGWVDIPPHDLALHPAPAQHATPGRCSADGSRRRSGQRRSGTASSTCRTPSSSRGAG